LPVQLVKKQTTSSEFVNWVQYLNEEPNRFNPLYFYLAQIAAEVRRTIVKKPEKVKVEDFVIKFISKEDQRKANLNKSKSFWLKGLGILKRK